MSKLRHFIFDLDGTVIDTEDAVLKTWLYTFKRRGYSFTTDEVRCALGVITEIGLKRLNVPADESFAEDWRVNYRMFAKEARIFPGVAEALDELKGRGLHIGVISSRSIDEYREFFMDFSLDRWVETMVLKDDTARYKPDPDPMLKYLEKARAERDECVYIGDMPSDIACARGAGVRSALVKWNGSNVICEAATYTLKTPADVVKLSDSY